MLDTWPLGPKGVPSTTLMMWAATIQCRLPGLKAYLESACVVGESTNGNGNQYCRARRGLLPRMRLFSLRLDPRRYPGARRLRTELRVMESVDLGAVPSKVCCSRESCVHFVGRRCWHEQN